MSGNARPRVLAALPFDASDFVCELREAFEQGCGGELLSAVELQHVGSAHPAKTWKVTPQTDVDELASLVIGRAQRDADAWRGEPQTYEFRFYYGANASVPLQTYPGTFVGQAFAQHATAKSFPATQEGVTACSVSMAAESHSTLLAGYRTALDNLTQQLAAARSENAILTKERAEVWDLYASLLTADRDAKAQAARDERDGRMWDDAVGMLKVLGPTAINRLTGTNLLPEVTTPEIAQFKTLFDTLGAEQIEKITGLLTPQQGIALADLLNNFLDGRDKQRAIADVVARVEVAKKTGLNGHNAPQLAAPTPKG
jgi:hypothetical protein